MSAPGKIQPLAISPNASVTYHDWQVWKQSLEYYIGSKQISDSETKKNILLHRAGQNVQVIYATLVGALDEKTLKAGADDPYKFAVELLDRHFKPNTHMFYERHVFRQIRQGSDSVEQFVVRLKQQAAYCYFPNLNNALIDQIIEGTSSTLFREKILEQKLEKVDRVVELGKLLEVVKFQVTSFKSSSAELEQSTSSDVVARVISARGSASRSKDHTLRERCTCCGRRSHAAGDDRCPAKKGSCYRCAKSGHFANCCPLKKSGADSSSMASASESKTSSGTAKAEKKSVRALTKAEGSSGDDSDDNCFALVGATSSKGTAVASNVVPLRFGGVLLRPIIDSGSAVNILDFASWNELRKAGCNFQPAEVRREVYLYGRQHRLRFCRAVKVLVKSESRAVLAKFLVLERGGGDYQPIVGEKLAKRLQVLRIGDVKSIESSQKPPKLGKLKGLQLAVPLDTSVRPVAQPCRRVPFAIRKLMLEHTNQLLADDIIERATGPTRWISPVVPVIKKSKELRLCIDMRKANLAVLREQYPIPTFEELVTEMTDCAFFSRIDLRSAYHQVEITPESRDITTFVTPDGVFRFKRLYCGIKCAPEMFQRIMTEVLGNLSNVKVFFDDIIVFSKSKEEHSAHVKAVLNRLNEKGLTINFKKSIFSASEIEFLGHTLSKNCIRPSVSNAEAIRKFVAPDNKKDLQSFLGLMNYVSKFINDYSSLTAPLRSLLKKNVVFRWSHSQQRAFEALKQAVADVKLSIFDPRATIVVQADASPVGLGAVLMQRKAEGEMPEILAFASRSLSEAEKKYAQIEREALGLVWACERFRLFTIGKKFELLTDHKPLQFLFSEKSKPNARIERWVLRLQSFEFSIRHISGLSNLADSFSRLACSLPSRQSYAPLIGSTVCAISEAAVPRAVQFRELQRESETDKELQQVRAALQAGAVLPPDFVRLRYELSIVNGVLLRGDRIVPPQSLRLRILENAHEGHPGMVVMKRRLRSKVWWPKLDREADAFVASCTSCLAVGQPDPPQPMTRSTLPSRPWEYVAVDYLGPLPNGKFVFVVIDYFTRFIEVRFTHSSSSAVSIKCLLSMFSRFGVPSRLKSDNAQAFLSTEFKNFLSEYDIVHVTSPPLWPQANGEVERQNRSLLKRFKIAALEGQDLATAAAKYLLAYHVTPHSTTGRSPAELMFNRQLRDKVPAIELASPLYDEIADVDAEAKHRGKVYAEKRRGVAVDPVRVGDSVLLPCQRTDKLSPAFDPRPYTVTQSSPSEVVVQRDRQVLRRSTSAVKKVPTLAESAVGSSEPSEDGGVGGLHSSVGVSRESVVPVAEPQVEAEPVQEALSYAKAAASPVVTRSGRVVKPPSRLSL